MSTMVDMRGTFYLTKVSSYNSLDGLPFMPTEDGYILETYDEYVFFSKESLVNVVKLILEELKESGYNESLNEALSPLGLKVK